MFPALALAVVGVPAPRERPLDLIVKYADAAPAVAADVQSRIGILPREVIAIQHLRDVRILRFGSPAAFEAAIVELRADPDVTSVEVAAVATAAFVPDDPLYPAQWDKQLIRLDQSSDIELGDPNVLIVVVDSVAECTTHPDLAPACRQDLARDFSGAAAICQHGYHVSGIAAAAIDNGIAIAGTAPGASIVPVRFLGGSCSGSTADALRAWDYAMDLADQGHKVVVNNSWGGGGFGQNFQDAIDAMTAAGVVVTAAAGNGGSDSRGDDLCSTSPVYPASYANVLTVAATDQADQLAAFSNYGTCPGSVEVAAPGFEIVSTCAGSSTCTMSGTSMADPQVAGLVALMLSQDPTLSPAEITQRIIDASVPVSGLRVISGGRIDLPDSLGEPQPGIGVGVVMDDTEVNQAATARGTITTRSKGGYEGDVTLDASGVPSASIDIAPNPVATGDSADLAVTTSLATPVGCHTLVVTGESAEHEAAASTQLCVDPFGTVSDRYSTSATVTIPAGKGPITVESPITVPVGYLLSKVTVDGRLEGTNLPKYSISLVAPSGKVVVLKAMGQLAFNPHIIHAVVDTALDGQMQAGAWTLRVTNHAFRSFNPGTVRPWTLTLKGVPS
jgi:thermitase